jgi:hypothetical protein
MNARPTLVDSGRKTWALPGFQPWLEEKRAFLDGAAGQGETVFKPPSTPDLARRSEGSRNDAAQTANVTKEKRNENQSDQHIR